MIPSIDAATGHIPPGRYRVSIDEVAKAFAAEPDFGRTVRQDLWAEWLRATELLRQLVPVAAVWLSGSFVGGKEQPSDIDCTFWIDWDLLELARADDEKAQRIGAFFAHGFLKSVNLRVDPYLGVWREVPHPANGSQEDDSYFWNRGHWDDFWQRVRAGARGADPTRADIVPTRGYLEVELDGYV